MAIHESLDFAASNSVELDLGYSKWDIKLAYEVI